MTADIELEKKLAAAKSLEFLTGGMTIGLGSGSTAEAMVRLLGERVQQGLQVCGVPSSRRTAQLAQQCGVALTTLDEAPELDLMIDGADEVGPSLALIKGGGGALLHEKIVAMASRRLIIIADSRKAVAQLGKFPLSVEVIPFAATPLRSKIESLGCVAALRHRGDGEPFLTEEGNFILDCVFGVIHDPCQLACQLKRLPGVVEHGLFVNMAERALIARKDRVEEIHPK